jgi:hypothetical protein
MNVWGMGSNFCYLRTGIAADGCELDVVEEASASEGRHSAARKGHLASGALRRGQTHHHWKDA